MEQLVIVIVIGAIGLIKWLIEKSAEQRKMRETEERVERLDRDVPAPPIRAPRPTAYPVPDFDLDKAARRLREALGIPEEVQLPPPVPRRPVEPPAPVFRRKEVKPATEGDLEQRMVASVPPPVPKRESREESAPAAHSSLDDLLRSRDGLRKAILVQEILGTPKGLVF